MFVLKEKVSAFRMVAGMADLSTLSFTPTSIGVFWKFHYSWLSWLFQVMNKALKPESWIEWRVFLAMHNRSIRGLGAGNNPTHSNHFLDCHFNRQLKLEMTIWKRHWGETNEFLTSDEYGRHPLRKVSFRSNKKLGNDDFLMELWVLINPSRKFLFLLKVVEFQYYFVIG